MEPVRGVLCIRLSGILDKKNIFVLNKEVVFFLKKVDVKNIVLNIKNLDYIDYYGKKAIINDLLMCNFNTSNIFLCLKENQLKLFDGIKCLKIIENELKAIEFVNL